MRAVLAAIGDELLTGARQEANCAYLAGYLDGAGYAIERIETVSDDEFSIKSLLNRWTGRVDLLILSGGLGPTHDDRTRNAIAAFLNSSLRSDALYDKVLARYASPESPDYDVERLKRLERSRDTQSMIPEACEAVYNPVGSALGIKFRRDGTRVFSLPGVPVEYRAMARQELPEIFERSQNYRSSSSVIVGMPELEIARQIPELINDNDLHVSVLPSSPTVELIVKGEPERVERADKIIRSRFAGEILPEGARTPQEAILIQGRINNITVSCAESCTGGLVQGAITEIAGSSDVFRGGVVTYANEAKESILGVSREILDKYGAVSAECAEAMARGVRKLYNSDVAVSVTGIAGPEGGTESKPVGTVWFGIADKKNVVRSFCRHLPGERGEVRTRAVRYALAALWLAMAETEFIFK